MNNIKREHIERIAEYHKGETLGELAQYVLENVPERKTVKPNPVLPRHLEKYQDVGS